MLRPALTPAYPSLCALHPFDSQGSPFCINVYPFFAREHCSQDFALFGPNEGYTDGEGGKLRYTNMFDAQVRFRVAVFFGWRRWLGLLSLWDMSGGRGTVADWYEVLRTGCCCAI